MMRALLRLGVLLLTHTTILDNSSSFLKPLNDARIARCVLHQKGAYVTSTVSETWKLPDQADNADIDTPT